MRKAFFLDRDGVVNVEVDFLHRPEDVILVEGAGEAIDKIHAAGFFGCCGFQPVRSGARDVRHAGCQGG